MNQALDEAVKNAMEDVRSYVTSMLSSGSHGAFSVSYVEILSILLPLTLVFYLPLEFLVQIDSIVKYMTFAEILVDMSMLIVFCSVFMLVWATFWLMVGKILLRPLLPRFSASITWLFVVIPVVLVAAFEFVRAAKAWVINVTGNSFVAPPRSREIVLICIIVLVFVAIRHYGIAYWRGILEKKMRFLFKLSVVTAILALGIILMNGLRPHIYGKVTLSSVPVARPGLPNIFLLTIDTLAAEDMALYGYPLDTTPYLNRFAEHAYVFDNFFANSNFTTPATVSIETGKYPWTHGVYWLTGYLRGKSQNENIAHELARMGYVNLAVSANRAAAPYHHRTSSDYNIDALPPARHMTSASIRDWGVEGSNFHFTLHSFISSWISVFDGSFLGEESPFPAEAVYASAMRLISEAPRDRPFFLWAHVSPPHEPYLPPKDEKFRYLKDKVLTRGADFPIYGAYKVSDQLLIDQYRLRYDEYIRYVDRIIGSFIDDIERGGLLKNSILIVCSDHGQSFSHGFHGHTGPLLYQPLVHIPLIVRLPGQQLGRRIKSNAEHVDLMPTILDMVGAPIPTWIEGESLKPLFEAGHAPSSKPKFSMNFQTNSTFAPITKGTVAVMVDGWKYILTVDSGRGELYNLANDGNENHDLLDTDPARASRMRILVEGRLRNANTAISERRH